MRPKYDYLIVGAGLFGCTAANLLANAGKTCLIIDRNTYIGGACHTEVKKGIEVHTYGPHIFRTSSNNIWDYVNRFSKFNNYINEPIANYKGEIYNLPFNMNTFVRIWSDIVTPMAAMQRIAEERSLVDIKDPEENLESKILSMVGPTIYKKLVKEYTEKQWEKDCKDLPASIISVLPLRFTYNNNYFTAKYQGIPEDGYTALMSAMLNHENIDVKLGVEYDNALVKFADNVIYTGRLDYLFDYRYGHLEFRGAHFEEEFIDNCNNYQGVAVMNFTDKDTPYLRITEHKHFKFGDKLPYTIISKEYSEDATHSIEHPYYPIRNENNLILYEEYFKLVPPNFYVGGVCGEYQNYTMSDTIDSAMRLVKELLSV